MFEQETYERKRYQENTLEGKALDENFDERDFSRKIAAQTLTPKSGRFGVSASRSRTEDPKQRQLMLAALALLMVALCFVLYRDRDFWFPDAQEAQLDEPAVTAPAAATPEPIMPAPITSSSSPAPVAASRRHVSARTRANTNLIARQPIATPAEADPPPAVVTNRTVLPPLNVEVVAGDTHRTVRPGTNSVRVDLEPGAKPQTTTQPTTEIAASPAPNTEASESAGTITSNAAERVQMSADTEEVVSHPVKPGYPMLARQMKVQGSVILRALIGKDGIIQDLQLVSGPRILAAAAEDAVRQWHFKPHYLDNEAVETQAKITVNFTISTN